MKNPDATAVPLTFNSTFTLPHTGDSKWTIQDLRPRVVTGRERLTIAVAQLEGSLLELNYAPELGGWVSGHIFFDKADGEQVLEQVRALPVAMSRRTPDEWLEVHIQRAESETVAVIDDSDLLWDLDQLVNSDLIDHREVRAHAAAAAAVKIAGPDAQAGLFDAVYASTLASLNADEQ